MTILEQTKAQFTQFILYISYVVIHKFLLFLAVKNNCDCGVFLHLSVDEVKVSLGGAIFSVLESNRITELTMSDST